MVQTPDTNKATLDWHAEHDDDGCRGHYGCKLAHEPAQALADLLKAAVEVDELFHADDATLLTLRECEALAALHAAVEKLS